MRSEMTPSLITQGGASAESRFLRELANQVCRKVWRQKQEDLHKNSCAFVANLEVNSFLQSLSPFLLFSFCLSADFLFPSYFLPHMFLHPTSCFPSYIRIFLQFLHQLSSLSNNHLFASYFTFSYLLLQMFFISSV